MRIEGNITQDTQPYPDRICGYYGTPCEQGTTDSIDATPEDDPGAYTDRPACFDGLVPQQGSDLCE